MGPALHFCDFVGQGPRALLGVRYRRRGHSALRIVRSAVKRADVESESSAAGGGRSEMSEWPRSKFPASAVRQRRNFGHRNRIIGPYKMGCRGGRSL